MRASHPLLSDRPHITNDFSRNKNRIHFFSKNSNSIIYKGLSADVQDVQQFHICNVVHDYAAAHMECAIIYVIDVSTKSIAMIEYFKNATLCGAAGACT